MNYSPVRKFSVLIENTFSFLNDLGFVVDHFAKDASLFRRKSVEVGFYLSHRHMVSVSFVLHPPVITPRRTFSLGDVLECKGLKSELAIEYTDNINNEQKFQRHLNNLAQLLRDNCSDVLTLNPTFCGKLVKLQQAQSK